MAFRYVRFFRDICSDDVPLVGGKNAALGEMYRELGSQGIPVPNGFAVTTEAYQRVLDEAGAWKELHDALDGLDPRSRQRPRKAGPAGERDRRRGAAAARRRGGDRRRLPGAGTRVRR